MIAVSMKELAEKLDSELIGNDVEIDRVFIDSRSENKQGLFVAVRGPHFDAHDFANDVVNQGATGLVVEKPQDVDVPQIVVNNSRLALARISQINRQKSQAKVVAITGSTGKTTVKEMISAILSIDGTTLSTRGNLNNEIGAPLTLLRMDNKTQYGVIELGANHVGEIAFTSDLAKPHVALVNNVSEAHLEGFGDLQSIAQAKSEIYGSLDKTGIAVINRDDAFYEYFDSKIDGPKLTYSAANFAGTDGNRADVYASNIQMDKHQFSKFELVYKNDRIDIELSLVGRHNVNNALAAATCCLALGISMQTISRGLNQTPVVAGRLNVQLMGNGCRVIDDTYNANVASVKAAIDLLNHYPEPKILVLGDMAELGESGRICHEEIGRYAREKGINRLITCGVLSRFSQVAFSEPQLTNNKHCFDENLSIADHFSTQESLLQQLQNEALAPATLLVKGSRSAKMENIVNALLEPRAASLQGEI